MYDTCVVWLGRHELLPAQRRRLKELVGGMIKVFNEPFVETVEKLVERVIKPLKPMCRRIIVSGTAPLSVFKHLADIQYEEGFEVWWPVMEEVARTTPEEALRLVNEAPDRRSMQCYGRRGAITECKVYEFKDFKRLKEVKLVLEDIA